MEADSLASRKNYLAFSKIAVKCCQWKQFFPSTESYFPANASFRLLKMCFFICRKHYSFLFRVFFLLMKTIDEIRESLFLRTNYTPSSGHLFFQFFQRFLKKKQFFRIMETYFSISFIWLVQTNFLLSGKVFFGRSYFAASRNHIGIRSKQSKKELILASGELIFWPGKTIFFLHFLEIPASDSFFRQVETSFQWNPSLETESGN